MCGQLPHVGNPQTIVVVHSNAALRTQLMAMLASQTGWDVYGATNGAETLRIALIMLPQLILIDSELRGMDGFATIVALRAHGITCPIVALVEHNAGTQEGWKSQGFSGAVELAGGPATLLPQLETLLAQG